LVIDYSNIFFLGYSFDPVSPNGWARLSKALSEIEILLFYLSNVSLLTFLAAILLYFKIKDYIVISARP
jgi:hypothetical protein